MSFLYKNYKLYNVRRDEQIFCTVIQRCTFARENFKQTDSMDASSSVFTYKLYIIKEIQLVYIYTYKLVGFFGFIRENKCLSLWLVRVL